MEHEAFLAKALLDETVTKQEWSLRDLLKTLEDGDRGDLGLL